MKTPDGIFHQIIILDASLINV